MRGRGGGTRHWWDEVVASGGYGPPLTAGALFGPLILFLAYFWWQWIVLGLVIFAVVVIVRGWRANIRRYGTWGVPEEHRRETYW